MIRTNTISGATRQTVNMPGSGFTARIGRTCNLVDEVVYCTYGFDEPIKKSLSEKVYKLAMRIEKENGC